MNLSRLLTIVRKELVDILRDRRTLSGMVVIPIVLYPVLILTFGPAQVGQVEAIRREPFTIVVPDQDQRRWVEEVIVHVWDQPVPATAAATTPASAPSGDSDGCRPQVVVADVEHKGDPNLAVRTSRKFHVGLAVLGDPKTWRSGLQPVQIRLSFDPRDVHSFEALRRTERLIQSYGAREQARLRRQIAASVASPDIDAKLATLLEPVRFESNPVTPGSLFLQIMPVILVLMTVTGAIYPAVDLTAGERERGTLETLMVAPVPTLEVVTGKFLVVVLVSLFTALLNVASIGASVRLIKFEEAVNVPIGHLAIILLAIIPLAMLFSATLIAAASFARSFKEAQNYVMPVVITAMVPAIMGALPGSSLSGVSRVVPVENIVLLARELVTRDTVPWTDVVIVLLSTGLYAGGAIAVASRLFGHEAVTFADAGSYRALFRRRFVRPAPAPSAAQSLVLVAVLFPIWFHVQGVITSATQSGAVTLLVWTMLLMVPTLGLPPVALCAYLKIGLYDTFRLRWGDWRAWIAAILLGGSTWVLAIELQTIQELVFPMPPSIRESLALAEQGISQMPWYGVILLIGLVPAVCEETLFRGFLLSGLRPQLRKGSAIIAAAVIFALYHALIYRFAVTVLLGILLGYLCWQSRSLLPGILVHAVHNSSVVLIGRSATLGKWMGLGDSNGADLPVHVWLPACIAAVLGVMILARIRRP